jgi:hypothetical protein
MSEQLPAGKIPRSRFATFLNIGTKQVPIWARCGKGLTEQTITYNAQTEEEQYIDEDSGNTFVTGYRPTISNPMTAIKGNPVFEYVDEKRIKRAVLADSETEILLVYLYKDDTGAAYPAERNDCSIQIDDFGGAAGESTALNFTINLMGDPTMGTFNLTTLIFLPSGSGS